MTLGHKILTLRKQEGLSQEQVAQLLLVSRQTISSWENDITSPDIVQAKKLAELFHVSLDELLDHDIHGALMDKIEKTEKQTTSMSRLLKIIGIIVLIYFAINIIIVLVAFIAFQTKSFDAVEEVVSTRRELVCELDGQTFRYGVTSRENGDIITAGGDEELSELVFSEDYTEVNDLLDTITQKVEKKGGSCE